MHSLEQPERRDARSGVQARRWRLFALNWLGVYPVVTVLFAVFGSQLQLLPLVLRTLVVSLVVVGFMVFVWAPLIARLTTVARIR